MQKQMQGPSSLIFILQILTIGFYVVDKANYQKNITSYVSYVS